ncbi:MAG: kelch repeat-containing protein [Bacillota bacterium]
MPKTVDVLKEQLNAAGVGKNQNLFSTINIGGTAISATSPEDTLELAAGTNVTLSADPVTKTISIGATGGGGVGIRVLFDGMVDYTTLGVQLVSESPGYWFSKAGMPIARRGLTSSAINGILYAVGGYNGSYLSTNEAYDPATNTWTTKNNMPTARGYLASSAVSGILYAVGGYNGSHLSINEAYDPVTNTWVAKASVPTARGGLTSSVIGDILYVIGGGVGAYDTFLSVNEAYDPTTNTWAAKTSMPTARGKLTSSVVGGILYAVGGYLGSNTQTAVNEAYDPVTNTWTTKASMPTARYGLASSVIDDIIYAVGGCYESFGNEGNFNVNEAYSSITNTWTAKANIPITVGNTCSSVINNTLYLTGGSQLQYHINTNFAYRQECSFSLFSGVGPAVITAAKIDTGKLLVDTGAGNVTTLTSVDVPVPCVNASVEYRWDGSQQRIVVIG